MMKEFNGYKVPRTISAETMKEFLKTRNCLDMNIIFCGSLPCDECIFCHETPEGIQLQYLRHLEGMKIEEFVTV